MPMLKTISGHTSARGIRRYLTKKNRALAEDYINLDPPEPGRAFDWAAAMDETRRLFGNDSAWRGRRARTYKHYVVSPDPKDRVSLDALRALATGWARESFPNHEVAIVYHDDNANGIPHAHVVVNNTDLETGQRLQDPDPGALARSLQRLAEERGLTPLRPPAPSGIAARAARGRLHREPRSRQAEYVGRAEDELARRGDYSWVADIRARVRVARSVSRSEAEFRSLLLNLGVEVSDNSPRAARRDWIYALAEHPSRKVGGERLGLSYSRERLEPLLRAGGADRLSDAGERVIAEIARRAVALGRLDDLRTLSEAVVFVEKVRATCLADLEGPAAKKLVGESEEAAALADYVRAVGILPAERPVPQIRRPSKTEAGRRRAGAPYADRGDDSPGRARTVRNDGREERVR